ncbi:gag-pol [Trichonephila clavipes]|nr:gag-pol [Trichonephila clavipes]
MEDLETTRLAGGNKNKNKIAPVPAFPEPVIVSPVPVTAFTVPVKLSTYDKNQTGKNRKRSAKGNEDVPLRKTCPENRKYCSRTEKKSGVIDQVVRQVTTPSTAELDPWSDGSVRKDQRADPEIIQL